MAFLLVLSFLTYFDRVCIVRVQGVMQKSLAISDEQMGLVLGAFWLAYALFEIPGGWMGDRWGARVTLTRVVFFWSLFTVLTGCVTGFISLLIVRFLFGMGEAGAYPNMARVQASWLPTAARGRAGGWLWLAARWGGALSPFLFAALIRWLDAPMVRGWLNFIPGLEQVAGWRLGFVVAGLFGFVWCLWFYWWYHDRPAEKAGVNEAELAYIEERPVRVSLTPEIPPVPAKEEEADRLTFGELWHHLLASRSLLALIGFYLFGSFGWSFFVSWMPRYLKDVHQVEFDVSESIWQQPLLYGGISCLLGGMLSDWLRRTTGWRWLGRALFPIGGLLLAAVAMFCVRLVESPTQAVVLMCLAGAAFDFGQGATWATIVDIGGKYAGTATGFINMFGNLGNALQPFIGALIFKHLGWGPLFLLYSLAFCLAASMWLFIDPRHRFHPGEDH
jgi:ACS family glucarate transporter-like MFS transporter